MKLAYLGILFFVASVRGHARLIEPPSRASEWRFGFDNPPDYNDNADYCGGIAVRISDRSGIQNQSSKT